MGGRKDQVAKANGGEGPWRGHIRRGAPDLAHKARPKSQGHTHSVPPWWTRPGSGRAGTAGPHTGLRVPQPGCTGPPSTHPGTGSCRKEHQGACTSRGHTWRGQRNTHREDRPEPIRGPPRAPTPPSLGLWDAILFARLKHGAKGVCVCL